MCNAPPTNAVGWCIVGAGSHTQLAGTDCLVVMHTPHLVFATQPATSSACQMPCGRLAVSQYVRCDCGSLICWQPRACWFDCGRGLLKPTHWPPFLSCRDCHRCISPHSPSPPLFPPPPTSTHHTHTNTTHTQQPRTAPLLVLLRPAGRRRRRRRPSLHLACRRECPPWPVMTTRHRVAS